MAGTGVNQGLEPSTHTLQLLDLVLDLLEPLLGSALDAADVTIGGQRQQLADLGQREPEVLRSQDESQALDVGSSYSR